MAGFVIEFAEGERKGQRVPVSGALLLGRSRSASLAFVAPEVSGRHLQVELRDGGCVLTQLGSGKTWVNGDAVAPGAERTLALGDSVAFAGGNAFSVEAGKDGAVDDIATDPGDGGQATAAEMTGATSALPAAPPVPAVVQQVPPPPEAPDTVGGDDGGTLDADDETQAMATRAFTEEEEKKLRSSDKAVARKRTFLVLGAAVFAAAVIGGSWLVSINQIENPLTWPLGPDGKAMYFDKFVDLGGASAQGEFGFYAPGGAGLTVDEQPERVCIATHFGKRQDVPCRLTLERERAVDHLTRNSAQGFALWREKKMAEGGAWNFDVEPGLSFIGDENGVPYRIARYSREEGGVSWFGFAQYLKMYDWELVLLKEIPASERYRGEYLLAGTRFFLVQPSFVRAYWEPDGTVPNRSADELLGEAEKWLAPAETPGQQLSRVLNLLTDALSLALAKGDDANYKRGMALLLELRRRQNVELNNRLIAIKREKAADRIKLAAELTKRCLDVFSDESDKRCHDLRHGVGLDD
jgi:hypothetical protein